EIGSDFVGDLGALDAAALPPPGEAFVDPAGKTAGTAADDRRKLRHLPVAGMFVDIHAADPSRLSCPEVALPAADPHKAQVVEFDVAVMALADVPKQHRLAKTVVGRLGEGARAGNRAAAVVEPLACDVPIRNVAHPALRSNAVLATIPLPRTASGQPAAGRA